MIKTLPQAQVQAIPLSLTFNINPKYRLPVNEQFSIGAGINAVYGAAELNRFNW